MVANVLKARGIEERMFETSNKNRMMKECFPTEHFGQSIWRFLYGAYILLRSLEPSDYLEVRRDSGMARVQTYPTIQFHS